MPRKGVTVLGEVKNPGVYPLLGAHGLLDLISAAGGVTSSAGKDVTVTHRDDPDHPAIVKIESKPGSTAAFKVDVRPGDTIMVSHAGIVYVVGDVGKPGGFLIDNNDRLTVLQALALAQGTNRTASLNHAKLIRKTEAGREEVPVPLKKILASKAPGPNACRRGYSFRTNERRQGCATRRRGHFAGRCRRRHLSSPVVRHGRHSVRGVESAATRQHG